MNKSGAKKSGSLKRTSDGSFIDYDQNAGQQRLKGHSRPPLGVKSSEAEARWLNEDTPDVQQAAKGRDRVREHHWVLYVKHVAQLPSDLCVRDQDFDGWKYQKTSEKLFNLC